MPSISQRDIQAAVHAAAAATATDANSQSPDRGTELFVILTVMLGLSWAFVLMRAYTKYFLVNNVTIDDWWMFASMIAYTGYYFDAIYGILEGGTGRHVSQLTLNEIVVGLKCWYISEILYAPVSAMVRTSVVLFLLRVSVQKLHRIIIYVVLAVIWLMTIVFMVVVAFQCNPPNYFYDQFLGAKGHCMDIQVVPNITIAQSVIGAVCDLVVASLPIAMLWGVQLNKRTKGVVAMLLSMGFVAGVALIVRIPYVKVLAVSPDFLYETIDVAIWSVLEPSLGIIAGCVATLRPLFRSLGFDKAITYAGWSSRRTRPQAAGKDSDGTWFSGRSGNHNGHDADTPTRPLAPVDTRRCSDAPLSRPGRRSANSVRASDDIELDDVDTILGPRSSKVVKTEIASVKEPWAASPIHENSGGIVVQTSIHVLTTTTPREMEEAGGWPIRKLPTLP